MKIVKQVILILCVSFIAGFTFNSFSPNGIGVLDNPWSRSAIVNSSGDEEPIMFIDFNNMISRVTVVFYLLTLVEILEY